MNLRTTNSLLPLSNGLGLVLLAAVTACEPSTSSSTHWLTCQIPADCVAPGAVDCRDGYCVDRSGNRISSSTQPAAGGATASSAKPTGGTDTRGGSGMTGSATGGTTQGAGGAQLTDGGATANGGTTSTPITGFSVGGGYQSSGACAFRPLSCYPVCQGGICDVCICPETGGTSSSADAGAAGASTRANAGASTNVLASGGSGGSYSAVCTGQPSSCFPLCEGGLCDCYCPTTGGTTGGGGTSSTDGSKSTNAGTAGAAGACGAFDNAFIDSVKNCTADADCTKVRYQTSCCGSNAWIGIRADRLADWTACVATRPPYPACGCASLGDTAEDGRFVSYAGNEVGVSCLANQCQTRVVARSCGVTNPLTCSADQVCVSYTTTIGPSSSIDYACVANPCSGKLDCTCGASACALRTDTLRTCYLPTSAGSTIFVDIGCEDNRQ